MQRRVLDSGKYLLRRLILDKSLWLTKMFTIGQTLANSSSLITIVPSSRFQECVLNIDLKCRVDVMNFVKFNEPFSHEFGLNEYSFNFIGFINPYFDTIWYHIVDNGRFYQKCLKIFEIGPTIIKYELLKFEQYIGYFGYIVSLCCINSFQLIYC